MMAEFLADRAKQEAGNRFSAFGEVEQMVLGEVFMCINEQWNDKSRIRREIFDKLYSELRAAIRAKVEADK